MFGIRLVLCGQDILQAGVFFQPRSDYIAADTGSSPLLRAGSR